MPAWIFPHENNTSAISGRWRSDAEYRLNNGLNMSFLLSFLSTTLIILTVAAFVIPLVVEFKSKFAIHKGDPAAITLIL